MTKNACDIMMHGAIESNNAKVKKTFQDSLGQFITMQGDIFTEMENAGLYTTIAPSLEHLARAPQIPTEEELKIIRKLFKKVIEFYTSMKQQRIEQEKRIAFKKNSRGLGKFDEVCLQKVL